MMEGRGTIIENLITTSYFASVSVEHFEEIEFDVDNKFRYSKMCR